MLKIKLIAALSLLVTTYSAASTCYRVDMNQNKPVVTKWETTSVKSKVKAKSEVRVKDKVKHKPKKILTQDTRN